MPDLSLIINEIIIYFQTNFKIAIAIALVLLYLLLKKFRLFIFLLFLSLVLFSLIYLISNLASTGTFYKTKITSQATTN